MESLNTENYFALFGISRQFQIDLNELGERYRQLQAQVHPDRFAAGSDQDKIQAIQATSLLNEAYQTLKTPQTRAAYMLRLRDVDVTQVNQADLSPELLMEQIQLREALESISRDDSGLQQLETMRGDISGRLLKTETVFAQAFNNDDLGEAKKAYYEMQYLAKLLAEIETLEEDLLGY